MHPAKNYGGSSIKRAEGNGYRGKLTDPVTFNYSEPQLYLCEMRKIVLNDQCVQNT